MATTFTSTLQCILSWQFTDALDLGNVKDHNNINLADSLADGDLVDQAEGVWHDTRTLTSSLEDSIDLYGTLTDAFGDTVNMAKVKGLVVRNKSTTAGDILQVGGTNTTFSTPWAASGDGNKVGPGGFFFIWEPSAAAFAVTSSSGDVLTITNTTTTSYDYDIVIIYTT